MDTKLGGGRNHAKCIIIHQQLLLIQTDVKLIHQSSIFKMLYQNGICNLCKRFPAAILEALWNFNALTGTQQHYDRFARTCSQMDYLRRYNFLADFCIQLSLL